MAGNKYIKLSGGSLAEEASANSSAGVPDANKIVALDAAGKLDGSMMPVGIGADVKIMVGGENLAAGDFVNVWNDAGTVKARKADASTNKPADGFVIAAVTSGQNAIVYFEGTNNQLTGLTGGSVYFLSRTAPGGVTATAPGTAGDVVQKVGKAVSATEINFEASDPIVVA